MTDAPSFAPGDAPPNPLFARIQAAVDQFGVSPPTLTRSRRHGHQPKARFHVENYFAHKVLGQSVRAIAKATGKAPSTIGASIKRGRTLVQEKADTLGFADPDPEPAGPADPWALE